LRFPFGRSASANPTEEAEALKADIAAANEEMDAMEARLGELEKKE
jgi:ubiquinone biosynthesis protein UbiJ